MKTLADYYMSLNKRDKEAFERVLGSHDTQCNVQTVAEYIATHDIKTERRISKKGVELIRVYYPTGITKEYEVVRINDISAYEF